MAASVTTGPFSQTKWFGADPSSHQAEGQCHDSLSLCVSSRLYMYLRLTSSFEGMHSQRGNHQWWYFGGHVGSQFTNATRGQQGAKVTLQFEVAFIWPRGQASSRSRHRLSPIESARLYRSSKRSPRSRVQDLRQISRRILAQEG